MTDMLRRRDLPASLDLLRGFEAAARNLSFTLAATELFVTQSAVSRQVQALEEQLGVKLFNRHTRALSLTEAGAAYYRDVARALHLLREATANIRAPTTTPVRVTTTVTFASLWLIPRLAGFQARFPDVSVHVSADNAIHDVNRASFDIAVRYSTADTAGGGAIMLFGEHVAPVCSPSLLERDAGLTSPEHLLRHPLLHFEDPQVRTPWLSWDVWLEAMHLSAERRTRDLRFSHYDQLVQAAVRGQGIALGRFPLVQDLIDEHLLTAPLQTLDLPAPAQNRAYWLIVSSSSAKRSEVQALVDWLRTAATSSLLDGGDGLMRAQDTGSAGAAPHARVPGG